MWVDCAAFPSHMGLHVVRSISVSVLTKRFPETLNSHSSRNDIVYLVAYNRQVVFSMFLLFDRNEADFDHAICVENNNILSEGIRAMPCTINIADHSCVANYYFIASTFFFGSKEDVCR